MAEYEHRPGLQTAPASFCYARLTEQELLLVSRCQHSSHSAAVTRSAQHTGESTSVSQSFDGRNLKNTTSKNDVWLTSTALSLQQMLTVVIWQVLVQQAASCRCTETQICDSRTPGVMKSESRVRFDITVGSGVVFNLKNLLFYLWKRITSYQGMISNTIKYSEIQ